jgi:hypothetical protein
MQLAPNEATPDDPFLARAGANGATLPEEEARELATRFIRGPRGLSELTPPHCFKSPPPSMSVRDDPDVITVWDGHMPAHTHLAEFQYRADCPYLDRYRAEDDGWGKKYPGDDGYLS